jgi:putative transposase
VRRAIQRYGKPEIINSDQGSQFTRDEYTTYLKNEGIRQSMDGKGRRVDNVVIERWFRSLKIEHIYPYEYQAPRELRTGIGKYVNEYNFERSHQIHGYQTSSQVYLGKQAA